MVPQSTSSEASSTVLQPPRTAAESLPKSRPSKRGTVVEEEDPFSEHSDESPGVSDVAATAGMEDERFYYGNLENLLTLEARKAGREIAGVLIRRCAHTGSEGAFKLRAFEARLRCTKAVRGNANLRGGWYAGTLEELEGISRFGFGVPNSERLGDDAHGIGVHLIPPQALHGSEIFQAADGNGEKHLLFCRVIIGTPEKTERGSKQFHPSSERFDSAIDDFINPKWYIVWSTHMNTHIIPECIVSFRFSGSRPQGVIQTRKTFFPTRSCTRMPLAFLELYDELRNLLPPSKMKILDTLFDQYKAKKLQKEVFVRQLRSIAGIDVIFGAIRRMKYEL